LSTIGQQKYALNKRRAKKYLYICKKSVNSDFIPRVIEAIVEHKPDKLSLLTIFNSKGKNYTIEKFLNVLEYCTVKNEIKFKTS
jgi:hypothetical protein